MNPAHIDDFFYLTTEILCELFAAFPVRHLLLVEDLTGPINWDMTGVADRKSRACFETMIWLAQHELFTYRALEQRDTGVEGAVLTQKAFVLLTESIDWEDGDTESRIDALQEARSRRAYDDLGTIVRDLLDANCRWQAPPHRQALGKTAEVAVVDENF